MRAQQLRQNGPGNPPDSCQKRVYRISACPRGEKLYRRQMGTAMTRYGQIGWRMAAVAAFVGTAVLAIALTRAPAKSDASLSYGLSGRVCPTSGLEAWLGLGAASGAGVTSPGSAGPPGAYPGHETYYTLEFTNVSDRTCSLFGYPEVS